MKIILDNGMSVELLKGSQLEKEITYKLFGNIQKPENEDTGVFEIKNVKKRAYYKRPENSHKRITEDEKLVVAELYEKGISPKNIAKKLHRTRNAVYNIIFRLNKEGMFNNLNLPTK